MAMEARAGPFFSMTIKSYIVNMVQVCIRIIVKAQIYDNRSNSCYIETDLKNTDNIHGIQSSRVRQSSDACYVGAVSDVPDDMWDKRFLFIMAGQK